MGEARTRVLERVFREGPRFAARTKPEGGDPTRAGLQ